MSETEKDFYMLMRKKKKIRQHEIAEHMGITQAYISMFETNVKQMPEHHIEKYKSYILGK